MVSTLTANLSPGHKGGQSSSHKCFSHRSAEVLSNYHQAHPTSHGHSHNLYGSFTMLPCASHGRILNYCFAKVRGWKGWEGTEGEREDEGKGMDGWEGNWWQGKLHGTKKGMTYLTRLSFYMLAHPGVTLMILLVAWSSFCARNLRKKKDFIKRYWFSLWSTDMIDVRAGSIWKYRPKLPKFENTSRSPVNGGGDHLSMKQHRYPQVITITKKEDARNTNNKRHGFGHLLNPSPPDSQNYCHYWDPREDRKRGK